MPIIHPGSPPTSLGRSGQPHIITSRRRYAPSPSPALSHSSTVFCLLSSASGDSNHIQREIAPNPLIPKRFPVFYCVRANQRAPARPWGVK
jgi:hypothetical protein